MNIQTGIYGNYQKVLDENGQEVLRRTGGGSRVDLSAYPTREEVKAYAPQKLTGNLAIHIDPSHANAADTLDEGRGLNVDKPFTTIDAAMNFSKRNYFQSERTKFILHSDITISNRVHIDALHTPMIEICSDDTRRTINIVGSEAFLDIWYGTVCFHSLNVELDDARSFLEANSTYGFASVFLGSQFHSAAVDTRVSINGKLQDNSYSGVLCSRGGIITLVRELTGSVTGRKYNAMWGGRIITRGHIDSIPGSIAGICDESSMVA